MRIERDITQGNDRAENERGYAGGIAMLRLARELRPDAYLRP